MGDEQQRHAEARLQILEQLQDLRLDGDVERGRRLVGDEDVGLVGERHRDHHALALAARELVRIGAEPAHGLGQADEMQKLDGAALRLARPQALVQKKRLGDLLLDRVQRIERGHRLLEHHGDAIAADLAQHRLRRADQLLAVERDAAPWPWLAAGWGRSCRIDSAVTDFPDPNSPTRAKVSPLSRSNDTPRTASTAAPCVRKVTRVADGEESHQLSAISCTDPCGRGWVRWVSMASGSVRATPHRRRRDGSPSSPLRARGMSARHSLMGT